MKLYTPFLTRTLQLILITTLPAPLAAQNSYSFQAASAPYTDISAPMPFVPGPQGEYIFTDLEGETFWFYGSPVTFSAEDPIYAFDTGYIILEIGSDIVAIDAVNQPLEPVDATTSVSWSISGDPGNKELLVQWNNWHIQGAPDGTYLSWQIAIEQATGVIEVHYGPNSGSEVIYTDLTGPYCGITYMPVDFSSCYEKLWVEHNSFDVVLDSVPNFDFDALHNVPPPNTLYRFEPRFAITSLNEVVQNDEVLQVRPMNDELVVLVPPSAMGATLTLFDARGRMVHQWTAGSPIMELPAHDLSHGVFTLRCSGRGGSSSVRFAR